MTKKKRKPKIHWSQSNIYYGIIWYGDDIIGDIEVIPHNGMHVVKLDGHNKMRFDTANGAYRWIADNYHV